MASTRPGTGCALGNLLGAGERVCFVGRLGRMPACGPCDRYWPRPTGASGQGHPELAQTPVMVIITTDASGHIDIAAHGPIKGQAGLVALLEASLRIAKDQDP